MGYVGRKMSENAVIAYSNGEMPLSKWSKEEILSSLPSEIAEKCDKIRLDALRDYFLKNSSWHHTSKCFNKTDFYTIDDDVVEDFDFESLEYINNLRKEDSKKIRLEKSKKIVKIEKVKFCYEENVSRFRRWQKWEKTESYGLRIGDWIYLPNGYKKSYKSNHVWILEHYKIAPKGTSDVFKRAFRNLPKNLKK